MTSPPQVAAPLAGGSLDPQRWHVQQSSSLQRLARRQTRKAQVAGNEEGKFSTRTLLAPCDWSRSRLNEAGDG